MSFEEGVIRGIVREEVADGLSKREAKNPRIINKTMTELDTEYEIALPPKTKKVTVQCRDGTSFRMAFEEGRVAEPKGDYFTIGTNGWYWEDGLNLDDIFKMYVACDIAGKVIEVIAWR